MSGCRGVVGISWHRSYGSETPVEHANQALHWRAGHAEQVLDGEEARTHGQISQQADGEGDSGQRQADDGEVLEVPSVRVAPAWTSQ